MSNLINANAFTVVEGRPVTSSIKVAECFGKQHKDVLESIRKLVGLKPEFERERNFSLTQEIKQLGATMRKIPFYWMDRKGFSILAMGFTGAKALDFKCAFYDEFERMEKKLYQCPALNQLETLTPAQQHQIQIAVAARAQKTAHNYQTIYRALKNRYQVARYDQIPQSQFQDALKFIQCVNLNVPETPITTAPPETYVVDEDFLKTLQVFCYYQRYLFRKPLMQAMRVMLALDVPDASKLWDSANDFNFVKLERLLDDLGFSVKELDCYKHWALTHTA